MKLLIAVFFPIGKLVGQLSLLIVVVFPQKKSFWTNIIRYSLHTLLAGPIKFDKYSTQRKKKHTASFYM